MTSPGAKAEAEARASAPRSAGAAAPASAGSEAPSKSQREPSQGATAGESDQDSTGGGPAASDKNIYIAKSLRLSVLNWWHVASLYTPYVLYATIAVVMVQVGVDLHSRGVGVNTVVEATTPVLSPTRDWFWENSRLLGVAALALLAWSSLQRQRAVYCVDFAVFRPPADWKITHDELVECMRRTKQFGEEQLEFMGRVLARSDTGQATHWPPGTMRLLKGADSADTSMAAAREEARQVIFGCLDDLFAKTGLSPQGIDFLIINCSLFSPTPSLCAMVSNHYKLRPDCRTYNLSGMGCSAGVISIDLAKQLLQQRPSSTAVVVSTENLTQQLYHGEQKSMLLQNTLFRCGGAAIQLSSHRLDGFRARYKLLHTVRTQNASDEAYGCVYETEDDAGHKGIRLSKQVTTIAGRALKDNLTLMGPHVLPIREQAAVVLTEVARRLSKIARKYGKEKNVAWLSKVPEVKSYVPNFKRGLHHFCIHAGGRAVIDGIEKNLSLSPEDTEPSRATLHDYGNTSSSSIWYELAAIEASGKMRAGHRVLQIAFGSGFKCNSAVWLRMRNVACMPQ